MLSIILNGYHKGIYSVVKAMACNVKYYLASTTKDIYCFKKDL